MTETPRATPGDARRLLLAAEQRERQIGDSYVETAPATAAAHHLFADALAAGARGLAPANGGDVRRLLVEKLEALPTYGTDSTGMNFLISRADVLHIVDAALSSEAEAPRHLPVQSYLLVDADPLSGEHDVTIERRKQRDGTVLWSVERLGSTLNTDSQWEHQPIPSSRDDDYMRRNRYLSVQAALDAARAAGVAAAPRHEDGWQNIATAPTDGTNFLAASYASSVFLAHWANGVVDSSSFDNDEGYYSRFATHWMPLPSPPATSGSGDEAQKEDPC